jgi:glycine/D-amino acid oxidase-like deaminating enzyme
MSPDTCPVYEQSTSCPGAYIASCHSGVTLAAAHAFDLAPAILSGSLPPSFAPFAAARFADVRAAA